MPAFATRFEQSPAAASNTSRTQQPQEQHHARTQELDGTCGQILLHQEPRDVLLCRARNELHALLAALHQHQRHLHVGLLRGLRPSQEAQHALLLLAPDVDGALDEGDCEGVEAASAVAWQGLVALGLQRLQGIRDMPGVPLRSPCLQCSDAERLRTAMH